MAYNLLAFLRSTVLHRPKRLRFEVLALAGVVIRHARKTIVKLAVAAERIAVLIEARFQLAGCRLVLPDLARLVEGYRETGDADAFLVASCLCEPLPPGLASRLRFLLTGPRHHQWMYDSPSACRPLTRQGFEHAVSLAAGATTIAEPGPLDLREREDESLYVEARKPG
jgi:hypothetical protein